MSTSSRRADVPGSSAAPRDVTRARMIRVGDQEGQGVDRERQPRAEPADDEPAREEADDLGRQVDRAPDRERGGVEVAVGEDVAEQRRAGRGERRRHELRGEQQQQQHEQRRPVDGDQGQQRDEERAQQVAPQQDRPPRQPVGEGAEDGGAEDARQVGDRQGQGRGEHRVRAREDEQGEGDPGDLVTEVGERLGQRAARGPRDGRRPDAAATGLVPRCRSRVEHSFHDPPCPPGGASVVLHQVTCPARSVPNDPSHPRQLADVGRKRVGRPTAHEHRRVAHPGRRPPRLGEHVGVGRARPAPRRPPPPAPSASGSSAARARRPRAGAGAAARSTRRR